MPCGPKLPPQTGITTCPGLCSLFRPPQRTPPPLRRQRCYTVLNWFYQASLSPSPTHCHQNPTCSSSGLWLIVRLWLQPATTLPPQHRRLLPFPHRCCTPGTCLFAATPPLAHTYDGPFEVLERSPHTFRLQLGDTSWLKAAYLPPTTEPALPRRRGSPRIRPPNTPSVQSSSAPVAVPAPRPTKRVSFAITAAAAVPVPGRPQRLRRPPACLSVSSLCQETCGGGLATSITNVVFVNI
jgi:hypothetical protein